MFRFRHAVTRVPESVVLRLIPVVFLLGALFLGGGCSVGDGEGGHSVVRGSGYSCSGEMGTGSVTVRTADGRDVPGGSGAIDPATREFSVTLSGDVPMRFIVAVTGVETDGARQADASDSLMVSRLVENPSADMFVTVTPLTTLVARYALKTGASLAQAEHAIAGFIKLPPNVSPSSFLPGPYEYVFSFAKFLSEWTASRKTFDDYIDALVDDALSGATHPFPGLVRKGGGVFKWILDKVFEGATGAATEEVIGWVIDLIKGDDPMADIQKKLDEMSGQLDKIYAELVNFEVAMDELLRDMSMEADYNTMLPDISNIRTLYDEKLVTLPKYRDRDFARKEADAIIAGEIDRSERVSAFGNALVPDKATILTHCNTGSLAVPGLGTALGIIRAAYRSGKDISVYADETRPRLQGARLTAWELLEEGIPATLIADSVAATLIRDGKIDLVLVGADRIAANGDTANKIGTFMLSVIARLYSVPFYVAAPVSTIDFGCPGGGDIVLEERSPEELTHIEGIQVAPQGVRVYNPAFDVTPAGNISGIVTEQGVLHPPFGDAIARLGRPAR